MTEASDKRIVWQGKQYRVWATIRPDHVNFIVQNYDPGRPEHARWPVMRVRTFESYKDLAWTGYREPVSYRGWFGRTVYRVSITEAGRKATERAMELQRQYEESQRAVADVAITVDALIEVQAIVATL